MSKTEWERHFNQCLVLTNVLLQRIKADHETKPRQKRYAKAIVMEVRRRLTHNIVANSALDDGYSIFGDDKWKDLSVYADV